MTDPETQLQSDNGYQPGWLGIGLAAFCFIVAFLDAKLSAMLRHLRLKGQPTTRRKL